MSTNKENLCNLRLRPISNGVKKKKFLGQNFLSNKNILEVMADAAELTKRDVVLEIGPGLGSLTEILAERAKKVIAVEKDRDLIPILRTKFADKQNVEIIEGDILTINPPLGGLAAKSYKIVANIPYYITSHFLRLFLSENNPPVGGRPKLMVLMIQKEVAERIVAKDGKESLLSLSVKAYGKPEFIIKFPTYPVTSSQKTKLPKKSFLRFCGRLSKKNAKCSVNLSAKK